MTEKQIAAAKAKIRKHYGLNRAVTDEEVTTEIASLSRKEAKGGLDDADERLYAALQTGEGAIRT